MKRTLGVVAVSLLFFLLPSAVSFAAPRTLRVDYYHTGNSHEQWFSLDRVVLEPLEWPGNLNKTIEEALHANRTFSESLRFPMPEAPVEVSLKERAESGSREVWKEVWKTVVDPKDKFIDRSSPPSPGALMELQKMGDPANKVDLLVLGDGYTAAERAKFEKDAHRFMDALFSTSPFREHQKDFNVWGLCPAAEESGVSRPSSGIYRRSPLGAAYDTF